MKLTQIALSIVFFLFIHLGYAQKEDRNETRFKNGKELLDLGKYGLAMQAFRPLTSAFDQNTYQAVASYYYAVAAFNDHQKFVAKDMFLQVSKNYPKWKKIDEVNLWLANR